MGFINDNTLNAYDHAGRQTSQATVYEPGSALIETRYAYDEWGRLARKTLRRNSGDPLGIEYAYDIRDRLTSISSPLFNEGISYDDHGNVTFMHIVDAHDRTSFGLQPADADGAYWNASFSYDGLHRLSQGSYVYGTDHVNPDGSVFSQALDCLEEEVEAYDKNGNILSMKRKGRKGFPITSVEEAVYDDLSFAYDGNQLVAVADVAEEEPVSKTGMQFADGADEEEEYEYDANGNMVSDKNKGIGKIMYNTLNLPETVAFSDNEDIFNYQFWLSPIAHVNTVNFTYAADGTKLKSGYVTYKEVTVPSIDPGFGLVDSLRVVRPTADRTFWLREANTVTYAGNYQYENGTLSKKFFADGYIDCSGDEPVACFYLKDHLGNVRMVVDEEGNIVQVNDYYPFGALYGSGTGDAAQRYKYNGKELERMHGLDWYDYGARWMDPVLCRFTTMDPLCEKYYDTSPYAYCANNPMKYVDLRGDTIAVAPSPNGLVDHAKSVFGMDTQYQNVVKNMISKLKGMDEGIKNMIEEMEKSQSIITIRNLTNKELNSMRNAGFGKTNMAKEIALDGKNSNWVVLFDSDDNRMHNGEFRPAIVGLAHELAHVYDCLNGHCIKYDAQEAMKGNTLELFNVIEAESFPLEIENKVRTNYGLPLRTIDEYMEGLLQTK